MFAEKTRKFVEQYTDLIHDDKLSHNVFTPIELCDEIISKVDIKNKQILVLFNYEFVFTLVHKYGVDRKNITYFSYFTETELKFLEKSGINYFPEFKTLDELHWSLGMKFDVVLGNPPFSEPKSSTHQGTGNGSKKLYPYFFKKIVELCDEFAFIMPDSSKKIMSEHNELLRNTMTHFVPLDQAFGSQGVTIKCAIHYKINGNKPLKQFGISEKQNDLEWKQGKVNMTHFKELTGSHGSDIKISDDDITIIHKINTTSGVVQKFTNRKFIKPSQLIDKGWVVFIPQAFYKGSWAETPVIYSTGNNLTAFNGMTYLVLSSKDEANRIVSWLNSEAFKNDAIELVERNWVLPLNAFSKIPIGMSHVEQGN